MPIRLRITLLFTAVVLFIMGIVCVSIYYFSSSARVETIKTRLTNRAITTAALLQRTELFDRYLIHHIDSLTTISLNNKSVQGFNLKGDLIYNYMEPGGSAPQMDEDKLQETRDKGILYFTEGHQEAVAYLNTAPDGDAIIIVCAGEDRDGNETLKQLRQILIISFIGGTLLSFTGGLFFSKGLLLPVKNITDEVNEISAFNLERRIVVGKSKDEWQQLSNTLNHLLDRIKESFDMQRRFISNASHELSTPLTVISSQLEIALQRNRNEEEYRSMLKSMHQDVQLMSNLVQTLLKFATAAGNPGGLHIDQLRIDEVLMRLPAALQKLDKEYSVSLEFVDLPDEENKLLVYGNEELLFTAFRNITSNACKFSADHHALVELSLQKENFVIKVTDKGIGIEESDLEKIFQPFYRVEASRTTRGFGLGLALTNRIVKLHKGTIHVLSKPGEGTTFTIYLPVSIG